MQTLDQTLYTVSAVLLCSLLILPSSTANHDKCLSNPDGTPVVCAVCSDRQAGVKWNVSSVANIHRIIIYKYSCTDTTGHEITINNSCYHNDKLGVANTFGGLYQHGYSGPASRIHVIDADLDAGVECTFLVYYTLKSSSTNINFLTPSSCTIKNSTECERDPDRCLLPATCVNNNGECQCQCSEGYQPGEETPNCTGTDQCGNGLICSVSPPTITSQPQDRLNVIPEAGNVMFAISSSGVHLSYSWQHNGQALSADNVKYGGTDTPLLTIYNIQETDEGLYLCIVTNQNGSVTSNAAILMLITPPEIVLSPQSMEVESGVIVELSCSAVGGGTLQFTWNTTANETLPAPFTKDMNSTLTFIMTPTHKGDYQCTVTNERGSRVSETATISISMTPDSSNKVKFDNSTSTADMSAVIVGVTTGSAALLLLLVIGSVLLVCCIVMRQQKIPFPVQEVDNNGGIPSSKDTLENEEVRRKSTEANPAATLASVPSLDESVAEETVDNGGTISLKDFPAHSISPMEKGRGEHETSFFGQGPRDNGGIPSSKDTLENEEVRRKSTEANPAATLASVPSLENSAGEKCDNGGITSFKDTLENEEVRRKSTEANPAVTFASVPSLDESVAEETVDNGGIISLKDFPAHSISPMEKGRGEHETSFFGQGPRVLPEPRGLLDQDYIQKLSAQMIVPREHIRLLNLIGDGEYGIVYKAQICTPERVGSDTDIVAVKTLKGFFDEAAIDDMIKESLKMKDLNHPNVLNMLGTCIDGGPAPFIVMPFMANGSLRAYLKKKQPNIIVPEDTDVSLICGGRRRLVGMCIQIARGMEYLASKKLVHRDLASRNCMIDGNFVIKVADFGLSESVYAKNYFKLANHSKAKLPLKWMAPESLNNGIFTEKTDVWSFGVVCWEIFTGGKAPYAGVHPLALIVMLENGHRLDKPKNAACSGEMYSIMRTCWDADPTNRPTFSDIVPTISQIQDSLSRFPALPSSTHNPSAKPIMSQVPSERQHAQNSGNPISEPRQKTMPRIAAEQRKQGPTAACKPNPPKDDYEEITSVYDQFPIPMPEKIEKAADQSYEEISGAVYDSFPVLACKDDTISPVQLNLAKDITTKPVHKPPSASSALRDDNNDNHTGTHPANHKPQSIKHPPSQGRGGLTVRYNRKALPYSRSDPEYVNIPTVIFVRGRFPAPSSRVSTPKPEVESEGRTKRGIITPHSSEHSHPQNAPIVPPKPGVIAAATAGKPKRDTTVLHHREPPSDYRGEKLLRHTQEVGNATSSPLEVSTKTDNYESISSSPYESAANYESISTDPYESIASPYESITASPYDTIVPPMTSCLPLPNHNDREEDENTIGLDSAPNDPVQPTDPTTPANLED